MEALIAYIKFLGHGTPQSVRIAGMGCSRSPTRLWLLTAAEARRSMPNLRELPQGRRTRRAQHVAPARLFDPAAVGRRQLQ